LRDTSQIEGKCGASEFRNICGGSRARAFAHTGDSLGEEPCCVYVPRGYRRPLAETQRLLHLHVLQEHARSGLARDSHFLAG
jgi:hypothetical protein